MASLDQLPRQLRLRIFRFLLASDHVRQAPNHLLIEHYSFEVQLLRVSRAVQQDAEAVLYGENKFVKFNWHFARGHEAMLNHEVPFFRDKTGSFNHQVADITIELQETRFGDVPTPNTSILLLDDIPKLARLLRIVDLANFMGYRFYFRLRQPALPVIEQKRLLVPFQQVRGGAYAQQLTITGPVDPALAHSVKEATTQQIQWLRAVAWEIYHLVVSICRQGDLAWRLGNVDMAVAKYTDAGVFGDTALKQNYMIKNLDANFDQAMIMCEAIRCTNLSLLMLSDAVFQEVGERDFKAVSHFADAIELAEQVNKVAAKKLSNTLFARYYYLLGVSELGQSHPNKAGKGFAKSYTFLSAGYVKEAYNAAKDWAKLSTQQRKDRLNTVLAKLPTDPIAVPNMSPYSCPMVASDHWVMRQLGYEGPFPYGDKIVPCVAIVLTDKPHPNHRGPGPRTAQIGEVRPDVLRNVVDKLRAQMNDPRIPRDVRAMCWVGLDAGQIGERSIIDDPEEAREVERMVRYVTERMRM